MVSMMMVTLIVTPAFAVIDVHPGNGGEGDASNAPYTGGLPTKDGKPSQPVVTTIKIIVNGTQITPDVAPFVDSASRTQAPFRAIGEALGCKVTWVEATQQVICEKEGFKVEMTIGQKNFIVNGESKAMDTVPVIKDGRTFIPVRALGEALDCNVTWDGSTNTVTVTSK